MLRRAGGEMPATHTHGATAEMGTAATHTHGAAAKVSSAAATPTAEVSATTAATAEVRATATSAAKMSTTTAPAETAASRVSSRRQTKRYGYCSHACRDFPHDTPRQAKCGKPTPDRPVRSSVMLQCTRVQFAHT